MKLVLGTSMCWGVRGDGDIGAVPDFLSDRNFADLHLRDYFLELRRLIKAIRDRSGDTAIELPPAEPAADTNRSPIGLPANRIRLDVGEELTQLFESDNESNPYFDKVVPEMRDGLFYELGVKFPEPRVEVASDVPPSSVRIVINDVPEAMMEILPDSIVVNDTVAAVTERGLVAQPTVNLATGRGACVDSG